MEFKHEQTSKSSSSDTAVAPLVTEPPKESEEDQQEEIVGKGEEKDRKEEDDKEDNEGETPVVQGNLSSRRLDHISERKRAKIHTGSVNWRQTADRLVDLLATVSLSETPSYSLADTLTQTKVY